MHEEENACLISCMHLFMCMCMRTCMCLFVCMCMHSLYAHRMCAPAAVSDRDPMKMVCTRPAAQGKVLIRNEDFESSKRQKGSNGAQLVRSQRAVCGSRGSLGLPLHCLLWVLSHLFDLQQGTAAVDELLNHPS